MLAQSPESSQRLIIKCLTIIQIELEYQEKNLLEQERELRTNLTHIIYDAESGNRIQATLVVGECSYAIPGESSYVIEGAKHRKHGSSCAKATRLTSLTLLCIHSFFLFEDRAHSLTDQCKNP